MAEEIRESYVQVKAPGYKEEDTKFCASMRCDFGTNECKAQMDQIKAEGFEPANDCVMITHEFASELGAAKMKERTEQMKTEPGPLQQVAKLVEKIVLNGKKLQICVRCPKDMSKDLAILNTVAASFGEFQFKHQWAEFKVSDSKLLQDILCDKSSSPIASLLQAFCMRFSLSVHKDLPTKIFDFISTIAPPYEKDQIALVGKIISTFHHLKLDVDLREPTEDMKALFKEESMGMIAQLAMMAFGMAEQMGMSEILQNGGKKTTAVLCFAPFLKFEFNVFAPTALDGLQKALAEISASDKGM